MGARVVKPAKTLAQQLADLAQQEKDPRAAEWLRRLSEGKDEGPTSKVKESDGETQEAQTEGEPASYPG